MLEIYWDPWWEERKFYSALQVINPKHWYAKTCLFVVSLPGLYAAQAMQWWWRTLIFWWASHTCLLVCNGSYCLATAKMTNPPFDTWLSECHLHRSLKMAPASIDRLENEGHKHRTNLGWGNWASRPVTLQKRSADEHHLCDFRRCWCYCIADLPTMPINCSSHSMWPRVESLRLAGAQCATAWACIGIVP